jgi:peptidoglycan/LPS O-acetylase OafA/YrhL
MKYVPALDGVRAIAVAAVLLYHGGVTWFPGGFLGVDVFFVLSGYLITSLLLAQLRDSGHIQLGRFWLRRARRLLPAAFVVIFVCLVVAAVFLPDDVARVRGDALASIFYVNNWHQVFVDRSYFAAFERPSMLQHLWSLAVEEQFYLLWPLALGLCLSRLGRTATVRLTLAGMVASALAMALLFHRGEDPSRVYFGTDTHASGLLLGALMAFAWPLGRLTGRLTRGAVIVLDAAAAAAFAAVVLAMASWHDYDSQVYRGGLFAVSAASAVLIAAAAHPASHAGRVLGLAPLRWVGARSYGIYLWRRRLGPGRAGATADRGHRGARRGLVPLGRAACANRVGTACDQGVVRSSGAAAPAGNRVHDDARCRPRRGLDRHAERPGEAAPGRG